MHRSLRITSIVTLITALVTACGGGGTDNSTGVTPSGVAAVIVAPDSIILVPGRVAQLGATVRDAKGTTLIGHTVTWSSADNAKVTVTPTGQVTAIATGRAVITATSEGKTGTMIVAVASSLAREFSITGAQFTQGVQDAAGSIPIVLSGSPAVVNVLIESTPPSSTPMQLVLRLLDAAGTVVYSDTSVTTLALGANPTYTSPSVQFLVPTGRLAAGLRWQVVRDPRGIAADDAPATDVFPRGGPQALATVTVPALNIRFVPIILASNGNSVPTVNDAALPEYLRTLRSIHPVGVINAHVGTTFTTSSSFGTAPTGGAQTFWTQVLSDLDLARIADPTESSSNWYGVVAPPAGFTFTTFGGFSYIPANGTAVGAHTRTSVAVRTGWFSAPTQARDLVAHELAHTFGRQHAPCGAAAAPLDPAYPVPGGVLDVAGHDVYSWANGLATSAVTVPASIGDVMGYCFPVWASTYTYKAVLQFRTPTVLAARANVAEGERTRVIVVRGSIDNEHTIKFEPTFSLTARPTIPAPSDSYRVEGVGADGRVLFSSSFEPAILDHAPTIRQFAVAVPLTTEVENELVELRVHGPAGDARVARAAASSALHSTTTPRITMTRRASDGSVSVGCPAGSTRGILVIDEATGSVVGTAPAETMRSMAAPGARLSVLCSDAVRTSRASVVAPN
jgi:hypothetical protein